MMPSMPSFSSNPSAPLSATHDLAHLRRIDVSVRPEIQETRDARRPDRRVAIHQVHAGKHRRAARPDGRSPNDQLPV